MHKKRLIKNVRDWSRWLPAPVVGVDEVGRGCLAGPVYAAAVVLDVGLKFKHYKDSKLLSACRREELSAEIFKYHWVGIGFATAQEIDEINILQASFVAMNRAIAQLTEALALCTEHTFEIDREAEGHAKLVNGHVIVDGHLKIPGLPAQFVQTPIVNGDVRIPPVSAASIVAKVARDQFMTKLTEQFPHYGFESHKGYGTKRHQAALREFGPCEYHRRSFSGVL
jgi:ribonuclease HII